MPVREALRLLASEGIVTIEPRIGASVTRFSTQQIREMIEVRATLEGLNAKLAARRHDPAQIAELQAILAAGMTLSDKADPTQLVERTALPRGPRQRRRQLHPRRHHASLRARPRDFRRQQPPRRLHQRTWEEHAAILRAVIAGDAELASLLASRHVFNAAQLIPDDEAAAAQP
jgi:DNA-binding GntR family transcriptional regulator